MSDRRVGLFERLAAQLRDAAARPPGSSHAWRPLVLRGGAALAAATAVGVAVVVALVVLGGSTEEPVRQGRVEPAPAPVGTVIRKGDGTPPRDVDSTVVAAGRAPVAGPWQMESYRSTSLAATVVVWMCACDRPRARSVRPARSPYGDRRSARVAGRPGRGRLRWQ
jgi:hypothetical protein